MFPDGEKMPVISLNRLLQQAPLEILTAVKRKPFTAEWMRALQARVVDSLALLKNATASERDSARFAFLQAREELIRERCLKRQRETQLHASPKRRGRRARWQENPEESTDAPYPDSETAWQASDPFDRLVS